MFPKMPIKFTRNTGTSTREEFITDPETGYITKKDVECNKPLPAASYFKIENQIAAGITLNEVNTQVITDTNPITINDSINKTVEKITKKSTKTKNEINEVNEVNNENTEA